MADWREEYLANLQESERRLPVDRDLIAACSRLADRVTALEAEKAALSDGAGASPAATGTAPATEPHQAAAAAAAATSRLTTELAEALRSRGRLEERLRTAEAELRRQRARAETEAQRAGRVTAERDGLAARLRDRDEELFEKTKLLKNVQDENLALEVQLNVTEEKARKVAAENKELVDRWMKRMAQEADAMNRANEPLAHRKAK